MDNNTILPDRDILDDILSSQKHITDGYNTFSNECVDQSLRTDFLNILRDEHNIQQSVFDQMQSRGWYCPAKAQQQEIDTTKSKFQNISSTL